MWTLCWWWYISSLNIFFTPRPPPAPCDRVCLNYTPSKPTITDTQAAQLCTHQCVRVKIKWIVISFFFSSKWNARSCSIVSTAVCCILDVHTSACVTHDAEVRCWLWIAATTFITTAAVVVTGLVSCSLIVMMLACCPVIFQVTSIREKKRDSWVFSKTTYAAITFMFHVWGWGVGVRVCVGGGGGVMCYRNWWPSWYFKRLRCILLSDCFPQIYICLKGGCGCQR